MDRVNELVQEYKSVWGKVPDLILVINQRGMSQEKMEMILEQIIKTGNSPLNVYMECKNKHWK